MDLCYVKKNVKKNVSMSRCRWLISGANFPTFYEPCSDDDGDVVNGLLMVQFDMVDMLRKKRAHKKLQRRRSERKSVGNQN